MSGIDIRPHISISPSEVSLPRGITQLFTAVPTYSDGTHEPLPAITWSSSNPAWVSIDNSTGLAAALQLTAAPVTITAACGSIFGTALVNVTAAEATVLEIIPSELTLPRGCTQQFNVVLTYSDGTYAPLPIVDWVSSNPLKVVIDQQGLATAVAVTDSPVTLSAAYGAFQSTAGISVSSAALVELAVSPENSTLPKGWTQQFTVLPTYSDGTHRPLPDITWNCSADQVAIDSNGLLTALAETGSPVMVTAASGTVSSSAAVSVSAPVPDSLTVIPAGVNVVLNENQTFTAVLNYSDGNTDNNTDIDWSSSDLAKVTVNPDGTATGLDLTSEPVFVCAAAGELSGRALITVSASALTGLEIETAGASIVKGQTLQLSVLPAYAGGQTAPVPALVWSSSDTSKVTVDKNGLASALAVTDEAVTITALSGDIRGAFTLAVTPSIDLALTPSDLTIAEGDNFTLAVEAQCGQLNTDGVDVFLNFDPEFLAVLSAEPGSTLSTQLTPAAWDNQAGTFTYAAGQIESPFPSGTFEVVAVTFKALKSTSSSVIEFSTSADRTTTVDWAGLPLTGTLSEAAVAVLSIPRVTSVSPADQAKNVALDSSVIINFNKAMSSIITEKAFSISPEVDGSFAWNAEKTTLTFTPDAKLEKNTTYTVTLSNATLDVDGICISEPFSGLFTTTSGSSGSSGGGGGGGSSSLTSNVALNGFAVGAALPVDGSGITQSAVSLSSADGRVNLVLAKGTRLMTSTKGVLSSLSVSSLAEPPAPPDDHAILLAFTLGPDGAQFSPALTLKFHYTSDQLPANCSPEDLYVAFYNQDRWEAVTCDLNAAACEVTAEISHFSSYALMVNIPWVESPPVVEPGPSTSPPTPADVTPPTAVQPSETISNTPASGAPPASPAAVEPGLANTAEGAAPVDDSGNDSPNRYVLWIIVAVAAVVVIAVIVLVVSRRRPRSNLWH